jgi:small acid-soluble spore protein H (minor)
MQKLYLYIEEVITLDNARAKEILSAPTMINVTFNGMPIYIESVNDNKGTANVHPLNQPKNTQEVPLANLMEH